MKKKYFINDGEKRTGPFSIEDLRRKLIEPTTSIWYDGLAKWTEASRIPELDEVIVKKNHSFIQRISFQRSNGDAAHRQELAAEKEPLLLWVLVVLVLIAVSLTGLLMFL